MTDGAPPSQRARGARTVFLTIFAITTGALVLNNRTCDTLVIAFNAAMWMWLAIEAHIEGRESRQ